MPRNKDIKKVLVIGSGPIIIGQAAEFDYAGTQACRSLKEEGMEVVLLNSNPATIMTDKDIADRVYIEPLTVEVVEQLILKEKPDSVLPTLGGQAGLNLAMELEEIALKDSYFIEKKLYPNVDFYSGIIFQAMGIPTSMFTVIFALARTVGWVAQWKEMIADPMQKIGRPRQLYKGEVSRNYVPITDRIMGAHLQSAKAKGQSN